MSILQVKNDETGQWIGIPALRGKDGKEGKSAYEIALENGFEGTEAEWLESLKGEDGINGALTTEQIQTLDNMFKKCAFIGDVSSEYKAFKQAFGLTEGGGDETPDKPIEPDAPTLTSISVTYTGGSVAVGTALTSLTGITVKATYSDGSTKNVTGYTLSGTIAEGSNTITVSYDGKTTTFTVTGVAESGGEVEPDIPDEPEASQTEPVYTLASAVTFDGTEAVTPIDTGYELHDEDKDWTIVCDYSGAPQFQVPIWNATAPSEFGASLYSKSGWNWFVGLVGDTYASDGVNLGTGTATNKKVAVTHSKGDVNVTAYYVSDDTMVSGKSGDFYSTTIGSSATVEIGGDLHKSFFFKGTVHDLKIYERVLSETEIKVYLGVE